MFKFNKEKGEVSFSVIGILVLIIIILGLIFVIKISKSKEQKNDYNNIVSKEEIPIPEGYYYVGGTRDTGFIISDNIEDKDAKQYTAQDNLKGNQWVWVPVEDINKIKKDRKNTEDYNEPYFITGNKGNSFDYEEYETAGFTSAQDMEQQMKDEYNLMIESIEKYHGFYIGRYELSENGEKKGKTQTDKLWYELYKNCKDLSKDKTSVISTMIYGVQWDATCKWISNNYNIEDSTTWGNYSNNTTQGSGEPRETGNSENWKANNIYDLAGNYWEWTQEAYKDYYRVTRGGHWGFSGLQTPVSAYDGFTPTNEFTSVIRY